tara:strand:+ start:361 stop:549 length:189 start_codon:yes stop_codon:yes gene_type:complete
MRKLYRNTKDAQIFGVCSGLADHFDIDPILIRVGFVCGVLIAGIGLLPYILLAIIVPINRAF